MMGHFLCTPHCGVSIDATISRDGVVPNHVILGHQYNMAPVAQGLQGDTVLGVDALLPLVQQRHIAPREDERREQSAFGTRRR